LERQIRNPVPVNNFLKPLGISSTVHHESPNFKSAGTAQARRFLANKTNNTFVHIQTDNIKSAMLKHISQRIDVKIEQVLMVKN
jgi:hypothetical protein